MKKINNTFKENFKHKWYRQNIMVLAIGFILMAGISIGYAALNQQLKIAGKVAIDVVKDIKIIGISNSQVGGCGYDVYLPKYNPNSVTINGTLPELSCTLEYRITVQNASNEAMQLHSINDEINNNEHIIYELRGIDFNTIFLANTTTEFTIIFSYNPLLQLLPDQTEIGIVLEFIWMLSDTQAPLITINDKDEYTIFAGNDISLPSLVSVTDNIDANITDKLVIASEPAEFSNLVGGNYIIKYSATDAAGNIAKEVSVKIYVIEFVKLAAGRFHTLALTRDGMVYAWGHNDLRQLGDGTNTNRLTPIKINYFSDIVDIAAGYGSSYVVTKNGEVYAWGYGVYGQLGHGNAANYNTPTIISALADEKVVKIDAAYHSVMALTAEGNLYAWGYNAYRQLGDGTNSIAAKNTPNKITAINNIVDVSIGYWHAIARSEDTVYVWGANDVSQLGVSGFNVTGVPTVLPFPEKVKMISAGGRHTLIVTENGDLYGFGYNYYGQIGNGTTTNVREPLLITEVDNVQYVSAGYEHSIATDGDGNTYVWGYNLYARLGIGNTTTQRSPVLNSNVKAVRMVIAQYQSSFFLDSTGGAIYAVGYNGYGGLGNNTNTNSDSSAFGSIPSKVIFSDS